MGLFAALFFATDVYACSCSFFDQLGKSDKKLVKEAKKSADAVFIGEIVEVRFSEPTWPDGDEKIPFTRYAKFRVEKSWKGVKDQEFIEIFTANVCCICGVPFKKGERYIIYANKHKDGEFSTNICTRTRIYEAKLIDEKYLGKPRKPKALTKH